MEMLPHRGRPVTEGKESAAEVSPEDMQRLQRRLQEFVHLYDQHPEWEEHIPRTCFLQHIPRPKNIPMMLKKLRGVAPLHGAKVLYLDDGPQLYLRFVGYLTLATRRRVELIFYRGETAKEIAANLHQRLHLCPQPHLLIIDENLEILPSIEYAGHTEKGHEVLGHLQGDLRKIGVPSIIYSSDDSLSEVASSVGATFVRKNIPPEAAVEQIADYCHSFHTRIQQQREAEERFITTD